MEQLGLVRMLMALIGRVGGNDAQNEGRASSSSEPTLPMTTILALTVFVVVIALVLK